MSNTTDNNVDFIHPQYTQYAHQVETCNDIYDGIDTAIKHLIQRPMEDDTDFENRKNITVLNNFVERICTSQAGMIFRKPLTYEDISSSLIDTFIDMDIAQFAKEATEYAIRDGAGLILVDIGTNGGDPYLVYIDRSALINWEKDADGNFTIAVILEYVPKRDGFKIEYVKQYRHIKENGDVDLYQHVAGKGLVIVEQIVTSYNFIPLYEAEISKVPPLYGIAKVNIAHMNMSSVLDNCTAISMQPSLFSKGLGLTEDSKLKFSTNATINTDNEFADVKWLELNGQSIPYGVDNLKRKEDDMAQRALKIQGQGTVKTATQVDSENSESNSRLSDIAEIIENMINKALNGWHRMKYLTDMTGKVVLSRDFKATTDASLIIGLNQAVIGGNLSRETFLKALNEAEIVEIEDVNEEIKMINAEFTEPINETAK